MRGIVLFALLALSAQGTPPLCTTELRGLLEPLVAEHYDDEGVYQCDFCFINSGELARLVRDKLGARLDDKKLRILVIRHKDTTTLWQHDIDFKKLIVGASHRSGRRRFWPYHAVLEYDGQILDPDLAGNGRVLPLPQYLAEMFPPLTVEAISNGREVVRNKSFNHPEDFVINAVPASEYLARFARRPPNQQEIDLDFALGYPVVEPRR